MRDYIESFVKEFDYPAEAQISLLNDWDMLCSNGVVDIIMEYVNLHIKDSNIDYAQALKDIEAKCEENGISYYPAELLFFICLSKQTRVLYEKMNIPYQVYFDSMCDLKWKIFECHDRYNIWGTFVGWWFDRFFIPNRFALGRLQFETFKFYNEYTTECGIELHPDSTVINMHIPSCGPLTREKCLDSYKQAYEFYKDIFAPGPVVFMCDSWLLFPDHKKFLDKDSNILTFMSDFEIFKSSYSQGYSFWRIFNCDDVEDFTTLPRKTRLQRAYADWYIAGNHSGGGTGVFVFDGENFIR